MLLNTHRHYFNSKYLSRSLDKAKMKLNQFVEPVDKRHVIISLNFNLFALCKFVLKACNWYHDFDQIIFWDVLNGSSFNESNELRYQEVPH